MVFLSCTDSAVTGSSEFSRRNLPPPFIIFPQQLLCPDLKKLLSHDILAVRHPKLQCSLDSATYLHVKTALIAFLKIQITHPRHVGNSTMSKVTSEKLSPTIFFHKTNHLLKSKAKARSIYLMLNIWLNVWKSLVFIFFSTINFRRTKFTVTPFIVCLEEGDFSPFTRLSRCISCKISQIIRKNVPRY